MNITINQALNLWDQLHAAMRGESTYDENKCEIYLFSCMEHSPTYANNRNSQFAASDIEQAGREIHNLVTRFMQKHECVVTMDEGRLDELILPDFPCHRIHLTVQPR